MDQRKATLLRLLPELFQQISKHARDLKRTTTHKIDRAGERHVNALVTVR